MAFRFTINSPNGAVSLTAEAVTLRHASDHPEPAVAIRITRGHMLYVPLDRIEELVTGIRDTGRQAADPSR
ncbi:hypothetical protein DNK48_27695 [Streptomyces malaysiensis subsp. malaysiensis]|uniref:hypothetical protein n=1 Tax=Streptomyces malaysiensis TaxID=92644 RepID=UPI000BFD859D|nr:hypothetical protein [Streptomyces malaysiensis]ATL83354.1 hypothetical protein SMALA_3120 [Streptomyces malaysiensis]QDL72497.1 hypothetical protein DNK48_27695 [Streptomyces malaysiensis]